MNNSIIQIIKADITTLQVEAIVNAANQSLLCGGGVDGAIHHAAGPRLLEECKTLDGCETGDAKITKGYNLPAKYVIHTVGPVYGQAAGREAELLSSCYHRCLEIAKEHDIKTIAFPAISTGVFRYPKNEAALIAITSVKQFINKNPGALGEVIFVLFSELDFNIYNNLLLNNQ